MLQGSDASNVVPLATYEEGDRHHRVNPSASPPGRLPLVN
jgi:hypothetical protein